MIHKLKKAFTLFELMVVLLIISTIVTVTMSTQKPNQKGMEMLYQRAYSALALAAYNITLDLPSGSSFPNTPNVLCDKLSNSTTGYFNTTPVSGVTCNANTVSLMANSFPDNARQFVTVNGMIAYISPVDSVSLTFNSVNYTFNYRVVFFDLNGDKGPNTAAWTANKMADIVGFIVTDDGDVLPIGYPEIDTRYMSAQVAYPTTSGDEEFTYSDAMTYYDAKSHAWGQTVHPDEIKSIDFNADLPAGSNIKAVYPASPVPSTMVDTGGTHNCTLNSTTAFSPCEVKINEYNN